MNLIPIGISGAPTREIAASHPLVADVSAGMANLYQDVGFLPPWIGYFAESNDRIVGACAFKSPVRAGRVEIAYFTFPEFEGQGLAKQMVSELISLAQQASPGLLLVALTLPQENASTSVLRSHGFQRVGEVEHPEDGTVWEWHRTTSLLTTLE